MGGDSKSGTALGIKMLWTEEFLHMFSREFLCMSMLGNRQDPSNSSVTVL